MLMDWLRRVFKVHSPNKEWSDIYKKKRVELNPIIPVDKDKQIVKIFEGKSIIIQFDSMLTADTIKLLEENIRNQIKENGFAVVDGRCKIIEFDNPKAMIETK